MPSTIGLRKEQTVSDSSQVDPAVNVRVDADGNVTIPAALAARLGLRPHDGVLLAASAQGAYLSSDSLRRIYVEATGACNLACVGCVRNTWSTPGGHMPLGLFQRLLAGLPVRPDRLTFIDDWARRTWRRQPSRCASQREYPVVALGSAGSPIVAFATIDRGRLSCYTVDGRYIDHRCVDPQHTVGHEP